MSAPGPRLHSRTMQVERASAELAMMLVTFQGEHDLTNIEMAQILSGRLGSVLKYALRAERHPGNPDAKADEE